VISPSSHTIGAYTERERERERERESDVGMYACVLLRLHDCTSGLRVVTFL
jgi:hypothetical protein